MGKKLMMVVKVWYANASMLHARQWIPSPDFCGAENYSLDRNTPPPQTPPRVRERLPEETAPEHAADAEGVGGADRAVHEADDGVEDFGAAEVEEGEDDEDAHAGHLEERSASGRW